MLLITPNGETERPFGAWTDYTLALLRISSRLRGERRLAQLNYNHVKRHFQFTLYNRIMESL